MTNTYTIDQEKLEEVVTIFNRETDPSATPDLIEREICADWNEGDEHQAWVDSATPQEIADWLASFYSQDECSISSLDEMEWDAEMALHGGELAEF